MAFRNGDNDYSNDDEDEAYYKHIPPEEVLPVDAAAPIVAHLLRDDTDFRETYTKVDNSCDDNHLSPDTGLKKGKTGDSVNQKRQYTSTGRQNSSNAW